MTAGEGEGHPPLGSARSSAGRPGAETEGGWGSSEPVPAMGGERFVPTPDPIARDYLLLALRLGQQVEGLVDAYYGPAELKAQADLEPLRPPEALATEAAALQGRLQGLEPTRGRWLSVQVRALETLALLQAGAAFPYPELVERLFDLRPGWYDEAMIGEIHRHLEALLPGSGSLAERLARWDDNLTVPPERLSTVAETVTVHLREATERRLGLPPGETVSLTTVTGRPWSAYTWYEGGRRSSIQLNVDLPIRLPDLLATLAHETYPGHHTEHSWKEALLVDGAGRLEASIQLINTPECLISEGLAEVALEVLLEPPEEAELYGRLLPESGVGLASRVGRETDLPERITAIARARRRLRAVSVNAALLRHVDGATAEAVLAYLKEMALMDPQRAAKRLEFIDHPLWRPYAVVYGEGAALVGRWLGAGQEGRRVRFRRLLTELLTPRELVAETTAEGAAEPSGR
jgi:hypothetical protein